MNAYWIRNIIREVRDGDLIHAYEVMNRDKLVGIGRSHEIIEDRDRLNSDSGSEMIPRIDWEPVNRDVTKPDSAKAWFHGFAIFCFFKPERGNPYCFDAFMQGIKDAREIVRGDQWRKYANTFCDFHDCDMDPQHNHERGVYCDGHYLELTGVEDEWGPCDKCKGTNIRKDCGSCKDCEEVCLRDCCSPPEHPDTDMSLDYSYGPNQELPGIGDLCPEGH